MRTIRTFTFLATLLASTAILGCSKEEEHNVAAPPPEPVEVRVIVGAESVQFINDEANRFNARDNRLADRASVKIAATITDGTLAAVRLNSGELKGDLWLASDASIAQFNAARSQSSSTSISECHPLYSTVAAVAFRQSDAFALEPFGEQIDLAALLTASGKPLDPSLLMGLPTMAASSTPALLQLASTALQKPADQLTATDMRLGLSKLQDTQRKVLQYVAGDESMLEWLSRQEGGQPVVALTSEQQMRDYQRRTQSTTLNFKEIAPPTYRVNYSLCVINASWSSARGQAAARIAHSFLTLAETAKDAQERFGFREPQESVGATQASAPLSFLTDKWPDVRRPMLLSIVVDSSASMAAQFERVQQELGVFLSTTDGGARGPTALIASSTRAELLSDFTTDTRNFRSYINKLKPTGGSSFRDGLMKALSMMSTTSYSEYRRAILVLTGGRDTSSTVTSDKLRAEIEQLLTRRRTTLYVVEVTNGQLTPEEQESDQAFSDLIESAGGRFFRTPVEGLSKTMYPIWRELR